MILADLDLGVLHPQRKSHMVLVVGSLVVHGIRELAYPVNGAVREITAEIWCQTPGVIGGAAAGSSTGALYLAKQLEELAGNVDLQPAYIQWMSTTGAITPSQDDGFYLLRDLQIDYEAIATGTVHFSVTFGYVSPGPPRRIGMWTSGAALVTTGYNGTPINWVALPINSVLFYGASATRVGGEGSIPVVTNPSINPLPFSLSATVSDWFKGGCHVYDAMAAIGTNPVPGAPTFLNTNWVEVKGADHRFVGDTVITNGLLLLTFSVAANAGSLYLWNTSLGTPGWQQVGSLTYSDNAGNAGQLRQITFQRVSMEDVIVMIEMVTGGANHAAITYRLQRGTYALRADLRTQSQINAYLDSMDLVTVAAVKSVFNSARVRDVAIDGGAFSLSPAADYGYAGSIIANSADPFLAGILWQNAPAAQPRIFDTTHLGLGDSSGPAKNAVRSYGFWAIPFPTPQNLQAEAESGALSGGFVSVASGPESNGNVAKLPNTTVIGGIDLYGTAWQPPQANYQCYVRMKCTTATSGTVQMQLGIWNTTGGAWAVSSTLAPNAVTTSYAWWPVGATFVPGANNYQFRAANTATCTDDWFIDQAVLIPTAGGVPNYGQDIWAQWAFLRDTKMVLD